MIRTCILEIVPHEIKATLPASNSERQPKWYDEYLESFSMTCNGFLNRPSRNWGDHLLTEYLTSDLFSHPSPAPLTWEIFLCTPQSILPWLGPWRCGDWFSLLLLLFRWTCNVEPGCPATLSTCCTHATLSAPLPLTLGHLWFCDFVEQSRSPPATGQFTSRLNVPC